LVEEGKPAPDFELESDEGERIRLSDLRGRPVVLYFYPQDDTPGCTRQACGIRDVYADFRERGATVLGVSPDTADSHRRFKEKFGLPFTLLADPEHKVAETYGVWVERNRYGKRSEGIERSTVIVDADGNVSRFLRRVNPDEHADQVLGLLPS
jgi:peroxiredoxin Q/BCP